VQLASNCPGGDSDVYYATVLQFDSGFATPVVSRNGIAVECGGDLTLPLQGQRPATARPGLAGRGGKSR